MIPALHWSTESWIRCRRIKTHYTNCIISINHFILSLQYNVYVFLMIPFTSNNWLRWWFDLDQKTVMMNNIHVDISWWRHQMEIFSALLAICAGIHWSLVNFPHQGQWRGALMFSLIYVWIYSWVNNREAGDLRRYRAHYDVTVMIWPRNEFKYCFSSLFLNHFCIKYNCIHSRRNPLS